jgi:hypothetical protein
MKPNLRLVKLTAKHALHYEFSHRIETWYAATYTQQRLYYEMFKYFTEKFGPGFDKRLSRINAHCESTPWGFWIDDQNYCYLYLRDAALTAYLLDRERWENYDLTQFDYS